MSSYLVKFLNFVRSMITAHKGRPLALIILVWLTTNSLVSEWPLVYKPTIVSALEQFGAGPFQAGQRLLFDSYQRKWPRIPESQPVTIVAIDEDSLAKIGQWPWPRNRMAQLIDKINTMQPLAIGLDIYMPEPDQTSPDKVADNLPADAKALARALKAAGHDVPVLAAGGIMTGAQMAGMMAAGAQGAWTGSVWLATTEAETSEAFREKMVAARSRDTVRSRSRTGKPARQLKTAWHEAWDTADGPGPLPMPLMGMVSEPAFQRIEKSVVNGNEAARDLVSYFVGQGVGLVDQVRSAKGVVQDFREEFVEAISDLTAMLG